uniref:Ribosomal biogenesis protein LAS1L n=1 Tax=Noccaea caerulescens TaxID=107243 RepID=A0A1J3DQM4_NOCCA
MEALAGIEADIESFFNEQDQQRPSSDCCKQVPWLSWEEWDSVRESLFSSSPDRVAFALERVATWRSRGSLPAPVDVTCSLIETQLKDGFILREKQSADALYSEHLLQMLYCMGILRLVNCVIEKTRRRADVSIADAAKAIGIPRKLIDLRHEGSHRELPALSVLRDASDEALEWLKSYYWETQKNQIPLKRDGTASIRREVKSKLRKLSFCFQLKKNPQFDSPLVKDKCSNKRIRKIVGSLVELYPSFSAEISSVLLEFLLKAVDSSKSHNQPGQDIRVFLDEWKPVILEFSNREPELLLTLLKAVLDMIQNNERRRYETDVHLTEKSAEEVSQAEQVPFLFAWLVGLLSVSKHFQRNSSPEVKSPNVFLMELLRKCLLLGALGYELVLKSGFVLADIVGGRVLKEKLIKLPLLDKSSASIPLKQSSTLVTTPSTLLEQEKNLGSAGKRLESVKLQLSKKKGIDTDKTNNRWRKAKTWSPCPIGMLPRIIGSSGRLPLLEFQNDQSTSKQAQGYNNAKRGAECNSQELEESTCKRVKKNAEDSDSSDVTLETYEEEAEMDIEQSYEETETEAEENLLMMEDEEESRSCLMIGGEWKKVEDRELLGMASKVKICV